MYSIWYIYTHTLKIHVLPCRSIITTHRSVRLSHINSQSITNKTDSFHTELSDNEVDLCAVIETWIKPDDTDSVTPQMAPMGYKVLSFPRSNGRKGGGIALVHQDYYTIKYLNKLPDITTMEYQSFRLCFNYLTVNLCIIYRLPSTSVLQFCNKFLTIQEKLIHNQADRIIFNGDFNIHMETEDDTNTLNFFNMLECYNLSNLMDFKTHIGNHTLDLVLDDTTHPLVKSVRWGHQLPDHSFMHCLLSIQKPTSPTSQIIYRKN